MQARWHSRWSASGRMADALSDAAAAGADVPVSSPTARHWLRLAVPRPIDLDASADAATTLAPRYLVSGSLTDTDRSGLLDNLLDKVKETVTTGVVGTQHTFAAWTGLCVAGTLPPARAPSLLTALLRNAVRCDSGWSLTVIVPASRQVAAVARSHFVWLRAVTVAAGFRPIVYPDGGQPFGTWWALHFAAGDVPTTTLPAPPPPADRWRTSEADVVALFATVPVDPLASHAGTPGPFRSGPRADSVSILRRAIAASGPGAGLAAKLPTPGPPALTARATGPADSGGGSRSVSCGPAQLAAAVAVTTRSPSSSPPPRSPAAARAADPSASRDSRPSDPRPASRSTSAPAGGVLLHDRTGLWLHAPQWLREPVPCGMSCGADVLPTDDCFLCDEPSCSRWAVHTRCILTDPSDTTTPREAGDFPLVCPLHQFQRWRKASSASVESVRETKIDTVGRLLGLLYAIGCGAHADLAWSVPPSANLPLSSPTLELEDRGAAELYFQKGDTRGRLKRTAGQLWQLAAVLGELDAPITAFPSLAAAFIRCRLSEPDRLPGWRICLSAAAVGNALSAVAAAAGWIRVPLAPYCGTRSVLALRGAFDKRRHSPRLPITLRAIEAKVAGMPRPLDPHTQPAVDILRVQSLLGCRPGLVFILSARHILRRPDGRYVLRFAEPLKTARGDTVTGRVTEPYVTVASGPIFDDVWSRRSSDEDGPLWPASRARVLALLHDWFDDQVAGTDFVVAQHGVRVGTDVALRAMNLPEDYIDQHGGWARRTIRSSSYYGGLRAAAMATATALLHEVVILPVSPGWFDVVHCPPVPDWSTIPALPDRLCEGTAATIDVDAAISAFPEKDDRASTTPSTMAPRGRPTRRSAARLRR